MDGSFRKSDGVMGHGCVLSSSDVVRGFAPLSLQGERGGRVGAGDRLWRMTRPASFEYGEALLRRSVSAMPVFVLWSITFVGAASRPEAEGVLVNTRAAHPVDTRSD
jgi:hypothetical protein